MFAIEIFNVRIICLCWLNFVSDYTSTSGLRGSAMKTITIASFGSKTEAYIADEIYNAVKIII